MQQKKSSDVAHRAWNILRLALLWARKGGVFKRRFIMDLPNYLKSLRHTTTEHRALHYGHRQLSFNDTPIIHIKMHRPSSLRFRLPHIPCINPHVDFDYDFNFKDDNDDWVSKHDGARKRFLKGGDDGDDYGCEVQEEMNVSPDDEGIDMKAEEFIARFYEQMKLQRQISYLEYN